MASATEPRIAWTEAATADLVGIGAWIARDSPANARAVMRRLRERAETLRGSPLLGGVIPELRPYSIKTIRELIERPWRLIYRQDGRDVIVLAVLDGRRDLDDLLLERLIETRNP